MEPRCTSDVAHVRDGYAVQQNIVRQMDNGACCSRCKVRQRVDAFDRIGNLQRAPQDQSHATSQLVIKRSSTNAVVRRRFKACEAGSQRFLRRYDFISWSWRAR